MEMRDARIESSRLLVEVLKAQPALLSGHAQSRGDTLAAYCKAFIESHAAYLAESV